MPDVSYFGQYLFIYYLCFLFCIVSYLIFFGNICLFLFIFISFLAESLHFCVIKTFYLFKLCWQIFPILGNTFFNWFIIFSFLNPYRHILKKLGNLDDIHSFIHSFDVARYFIFLGNISLFIYLFLIDIGKYLIFQAYYKCKNHYNPAKSK